MASGFNQSDYLAQLKALLPVGSLWESLKNDTVFGQLLSAISEEFARLDSRANLLCSELDPRTANELFFEWETFAGLPDPCTGQLPTMEQRRAAIVSRLIATGGQSRQYFIDLALALGFVITISEYDGINPSLVTQNHWQVNAPNIGSVVEFRVNSRVEERLRQWPSNEILECMINRLKPAHTVVVFNYS